MKKIMIIVVVLAVLGVYFKEVKREIVDLKANVEVQEAQLQECLRHRSELGSQLVEVMRDYAEPILLLKASNASIGLEGSFDSYDFEAMGEAGNELEAAINELMSVTSSELEENVDFLNLQEELAYNKEEILEIREIYLERAKQYDEKIQTFPASFVAWYIAYYPTRYIEIDFD